MSHLIIYYTLKGGSDFGLGSLNEEEVLEATVATPRPSLTQNLSPARIRAENANNETLDLNLPQITQL